jgi:hypothetical protein
MRLYDYFKIMNPVYILDYKSKYTSFRHNKLIQKQKISNIQNIILSGIA